MGTNKLPTDAQMTVWREAGKLICNCRTPDPWYLPLWCARECRRCGKLIIHNPSAQELLRRHTQLTDDEQTVS